MADPGDFKAAVDRASRTSDLIVLDVKGVAKLTTLSPSTIYELARRDKFPKQRKIGAQRVVWVRSEVVDWIDAKLAEAEAA